VEHEKLEASYEMMTSCVELFRLKSAAMLAEANRMAEAEAAQQPKPQK
jgi:hypothetical protein